MARLVRGTCVFFCVAAASFGASTLFGAAADTWNNDPEISQRIARYHAAGEPVEPNDIRPSDVADSDNAVIELRQAEALLPDFDAKGNPFVQYDEGDLGFPMTSKEKELALQASKQLAPAIALTDKAMEKKAFRWPTEPKSPLIDVTLPDLSKQREMALVLDMQLVLDHTEGHDAAALADIRRVLFLSDASDHEMPFMVVELVSLGIRSMACDMLRKIEPTLKIGDGLVAASPKAVSELIEQMLRTADRLRPIFRRSELVERMEVLDSADALKTGQLDAEKFTPRGKQLPGNSVLANRLVRDSIPGDLPMMLDQLTEAAEVFNCPDWPAAKKKVPTTHDLGNDPTKHLFAQIFLSSVGRAQLPYRTIADLRVAATVLAIRSYQADHRGALPENLETLTPKYLSAVPADPFAEGNAPLHYVAEGPDPRVYSLCIDGTNGQGKKFNMSQTSNLGKWAVVNHLVQQPRDTSKLPANLKD